MLVASALVLLAMGRVPMCTCGYIKLWHGVVASSENSQHITDWYTFSHVIHGFGFYFLFWFLGHRRGWPLGLRLVLALVVESGWEILENTPMIINRYRAQTIALDYYGDSVLNSIADILAMVIGFFMAAGLPIWSVVAVAVGLEAGVAFFIRDNLTLNVIQLLYPMDWILKWQRGG